MKKVKVRLDTEQLRIKVRIDDVRPIKVKVNNAIVQVGDYEHYDGEYTFTPNFEQQKVNAKNKVMDSDLVIESIPITTVTNTSGGKTAIIGG